MFQDVLAGNENLLNFVTSMGDDGDVTYSFGEGMRMKGFTKRMMRGLDNLIEDIDIVRVRGDADIEFKGVDEMPNGYDTAAGLAFYQYDANGDAGVDLLFDWDKIDYTNNRFVNRNSRKYTILHEIGHAFGLEHPFDNRDGDSIQGETSYFSVMSYNRNDQVENGRVRNYTNNDIDTISGIWNDTSRFSKAIEAPQQDAKPLPLCFTCGCRHC